MKKSILSVVVSALLVTSAYAQDQGHGTVTFTGSIIDAPCSISNDTVDQSIYLGQISDATLQQNGNTGSSTPTTFEIKLVNCTLDTEDTVKATFTGAAGKAGLLGITGDAKGAGIQLTEGNGDPIVLGQETSGQTLQNGDNTLLFAAFLKGEGDIASNSIVPGSFTGITNFTLSYE